MRPDFWEVPVLCNHKSHIAPPAGHFTLFSRRKSRRVRELEEERMEEGGTAGEILLDEKENCSCP